jgi:putative endonuclease
MQISSSSSDPGSTIRLGRRGESLAAAYLLKVGYQLVAANFSLPVGRNRNGAIVNAEIDLIAYETSTLCFVEVKTRASDWFAVPSVNVDLRKRRQITRAARAYRRMFGLINEPHRFDVVSVIAPSAPEEDVEIELRRGFWREETFRKGRWMGEYYD